MRQLEFSGQFAGTVNPDTELRFISAIGESSSDKNRPRPI